MKQYLLVLAVLLSVLSCNQDLLDFNLFDAKSDAVFSAFVEVFYEDGNPAKNALVIVDKISVLTDASGMAYIKDIEMDSSVYLVVSKGDYFHASRRFTPIKNEAQYIKVVLLSAEPIGQLQAQDGGVMIIDENAELDFPPNAIQYANGLSYFGTVSVSAKSIAANDPDMSFKMPGDLMGEALDGETVALGSMGMVAVELRGQHGEVLQVKTGMQVGLTIRVPTEQQASAPATIPLWYFDEDAGIWKEEGEATFILDKYVGYVSHFSYWNCDASFSLVEWNASFYYESGPASNVTVCITIISLNTTRCAYANNQGEVRGSIPAGERLLLEVYDKCGAPAFSGEIGPFSEPATTYQSLDEESLGVLSVTGKAVDCNGHAVVNGYAIVRIGALTSYAELDKSNGAFEIRAAHCVEDEVLITIVDVEESRHSFIQKYEYSNTINAGSISVCDPVRDQIVIDVEGLGKFVFHEVPARLVRGYTSIGIPDSVPINTAYISMQFEGQSQGNFNAWMTVNLELPDGEFINIRGKERGVNVFIANYGEVGDYVIGTISGTLKEYNSGTDGKEYEFNGTISALRER
ncbi:MAG: hypothetical protein DRI69_00200 [Bacteroidetes bacterium]|nr:MAG: hypothetical protein DRI69_00200 [Bacteroidota bacterium]